MRDGWLRHFFVPTWAQDVWMWDEDQCQVYCSSLWSEQLCNCITQVQQARLLESPYPLFVTPLVARRHRTTCQVSSSQSAPYPYPASLSFCEIAHVPAPSFRYRTGSHRFLLRTSSAVSVIPNLEWTGISCVCVFHPATRSLFRCNCACCAAVGSRVNHEWLSDFFHDGLCEDQLSRQMLRTRTLPIHHWTRPQFPVLDIRSSGEIDRRNARYKMCSSASPGHQPVSIRICRDVFQSLAQVIRFQIRNRQKAFQVACSVEEFFLARWPSSSAEVRGLVIHDIKEVEGVRKQEEQEDKRDEEIGDEVNGEVEEVTHRAHETWRWRWGERRLILETAWAGQCACIQQGRQSKDNDTNWQQQWDYENEGSSMHEDSCIGINCAHMFPECFRSLHTLLGFALYFMSSIFNYCRCNHLLNFWPVREFLVEIHTAKTGLLRCCLYTSPSVAADRRQL